MKKGIILLLVALMIGTIGIKLSKSVKTFDSYIPEKATIIRVSKKVMGEEVVYGIQSNCKQQIPQAITVVSDIQQLSDLEYILRMVYDCQQGDSASINNTLKQYGDEFFKDRKLIVMPFTEGSGSNRIVYDHIKMDGEVASIYINRIVPEVGTCDMAYWLMFLEIDSEYYKAVNFFDVIVH